MKRTTPELNNVWSRVLRTVLMILPLGLSGCFDDHLPPAGSFGLAVSVSGSGQVTSSPAGIACGSDCAETLASGSTITLSATPASGAMFTGWGGDCSGSTPSCTLTMSASRAVTASFTFSTDPPPPAAQYTLSVNVTGSGSVSSTPAGISCGADCSENYPDGTSVTLTATPGTGFQFSSWSGACSGTGNCVVAMSAARNVSASFAPNQYGLTVQVSGTGTISSSPAGITCGSDCTENYNYGTSVTLTASPGTNQQFSGWTNACTGTQFTCAVSMTEARSVSASFTPVTRALTVTLNGTGSVTSTPAGINCGTDCTENYTHGSNVTLTASPGANQQFSGWLGACSGTVTSCVLTMSEARSVTATFTPVPAAQFTLTVTAGITGSGLITSTPAGISCGADCTESYASGTSVTLTATPEMGFQFSGWGGACSGSSACVVVMSANRTVAATFSNSTDRILFEESFNNFSAYSPGIHITEGARAEHSTGWNGDGAVKMYLGTPADPTWAHYSGWYRPTVDPSSFQADRVHVRWCAQFGPTLFQSLGDGGKLLITHRNVSNRDINPRVMAHIHNYSPAGRQIYSDNNIDNGPPNPPAFTLEDKVQQWMCFEIGVSQQNNTREFWATVEGGPEVLLQSGSLNRTDGIWTGGTEFGYWGPVSNVDADSWWKLDELVVSNAKIGPPPGFAAP